MLKSNLDIKTSPPLDQKSWTTLPLSSLLISLFPPRLSDLGPLDLGLFFKNQSRDPWIASGVVDGVYSGVVDLVSLILTLGSSLTLSPSLSLSLNQNHHHLHCRSPLASS